MCRKAPTTGRVCYNKTHIHSPRSKDRQNQNIEKYCLWKKGSRMVSLSQHQQRKIRILDARVSGMSHEKSMFLESDQQDAKKHSFCSRDRWWSQGKISSRIQQILQHSNSFYHKKASHRYAVNVEGSRNRRSSTSASQYTTRMQPNRQARLLTFSNRDFSLGWRSMGASDTSL